MIKFSLSDLEEAIANPRAFREKIAKRNTSDIFYPKSYFSQLKYAIYKFHDLGNDANKGEEYLILKLADFTSDVRKEELLDQFHWYVEDFIRENTIMFGRRYLTSIQHLQGITIDFELTGEVNRLDIRPTGGYAAWLFRRNNPAGWINELRMPLIQAQLSKDLNASPNEVSIGIYSFEERMKEEICYSSQNIAEAKRRFDNFVRDYLKL